MRYIRQLRVCQERQTIEKTKQPEKGQVQHGINRYITNNIFF